MSGRSAVLLALAACAAGVLGALLLVRATDPAAELGPTDLRVADRDEPLVGRVATLEVPEEPAPARIGGETPVPEPLPIPVAPADTPPSVMELPEGTLVEMQIKRDAIQAELAERSTPILTQRFADNLTERVSDEKRYSYSTKDNEEILAVMMPVEGGTYRTALPRAEYPELYELKDATLRLDKLVSAKEVAEYMAKQKKP